MDHNHHNITMKTPSFNAFEQEEEEEEVGSALTDTTLPQLVLTFPASSDPPSRSNDSAFPMRLHIMIQWIERNYPKSSGPIYWLSHGRAFVIQDIDTLVKTVLPQFFGRTKMQSFTRKLNRWGFSIIRSGPDKGAYMHRDFVRWEEPRSITKMSKDGKRTKASKLREMDKLASTLERKDDQTEQSSSQGEKVDEDDRKMPPRVENENTHEILNQNCSGALYNFEFGGFSVEPLHSLDAPNLGDHGSQDSTDKKLDSRARVATNPNFEVALKQKNPPYQIDTLSTFPASGVQGQGGQACPNGTTIESIDFISVLQNNDVTSTFSANTHDFNIDDQHFSASRSIGFPLMGPGQSTNAFNNTGMMADNAVLSGLNTRMNDIYNNNTAASDRLRGISSIQTNIMATGSGASNAGNSDSYQFNDDIDGEINPGFCNVLEDDIFSPLAIFPPHSGRDILQGRLRACDSASANVQSEEDAKKSVSKEAVSEEQINRDLTEFFSRLEETLKDEERKGRPR